MKNMQSTSLEETTKIPKRIITLDMLRGVAIFGMTLFHILFKMYDVESFMANQEEILNFPIILLIIMGLFAYFGSWYGFFLFISSIVNSFVFTRKSKANLNPSKLLIKQIFTGFTLIVISYFIEGILGYYGDIGYSIKNLEWTNFEYFKIEALWIQTLQIIGLCLIINGPKQPLFPYLASSFMGAIIGMLLANPKPPKRMLIWFSLVGLT
ncbi:MAG: hypothetical protein ACW96U_14610, partial [Candidatus Heimdallarchaeaceae archaeon]